MNFIVIDIELSFLLMVVDEVFGLVGVESDEINYKDASTDWLLITVGDKRNNALSEKCSN